MRPRRGDVWLVDFGEPIGREQSGFRPAVVVSDDEMNRGPAGLIIVIPVTTTRRGLPSHVEIDDTDSGLDEVSYAKCEDVKSVSDLRMVTRLGEVPMSCMHNIGRVLRFILSL